MQVSLSVDPCEMKESSVEWLGASSSRYADPEAEGVRPVLRTRTGSRSVFAYI